MPRKDGLEASAAIRELEIANGWEPARIVALTGLSNEVEMQKALGNDGPIDSWLVKGGKSLRVILDEIANQQKELDEQGFLTSPRL
jgi:CheY-like chemotaxis protein